MGIRSSSIPPRNDTSIMHTTLLLQLPVTYWCRWIQVVLVVVLCMGSRSHTAYQLQAPSITIWNHYHHQRRQQRQRPVTPRSTRDDDAVSTTVSSTSSAASFSSISQPSHDRCRLSYLGTKRRRCTSALSSLTSSSTLQQEYAQSNAVPRTFVDGTRRSHDDLTSTIYQDENPTSRSTATTTKRNPSRANVYLHPSKTIPTTRTAVSNANGISNVDSQAWNVPEPLIGTFTTSLTSTSSSSLESASSSTHDASSSIEQQSRSAATSTSTTMPWIPTEQDIDQLTIVQLKRELGIRALKKGGNKYLLQNRFKEWMLQHPPSITSSSSTTTNTNGRRQSSVGRTSRDSTTVATTTSSSSSKVSSFMENELPSWGIEMSSFLLPDNDDENIERPSSDTRTKSNAVVHDKLQSVSTSDSTERLNVDSLQEWVRTVDLEPLLHRREAIHREKLIGPPKKDTLSNARTERPQLPSDLRAVIQKMFDQPSSIYSNLEVQQMYAAAKQADQMGDRSLSKRILYELQIATPHDARVYRRLARMEYEDNQMDQARSILQTGLDLHPDNAFLWHGLGQLEGSLGNVTAQRLYWEKAIEVDPYIPHSYHALGILDHTHGRVANAMKILTNGIHYCPTNHRLHHALGDLYRDAKMLPLARMSYQKAIQYGPPVCHGFAYTALSYVSYEEGNMDQCRHYLRKAVHLNHGRHANGWVALAQMEESEGNIDAARTACMVAIGQYERGLIEQSRRTILQQQQQQRTTHHHQTFSLSENPVTLRNKILQTIPTYRSGDRFFNVYRNWLRLEERYGTIENVEEVYERAMVAFPHEHKIMTDAAQYFVRLNLYTRARDVFTKACTRVNHRKLHADPYRLFAELEMELGNYIDAQKILYSGAMTLSKYASPVSSTRRRGLPQLFLTWAVCEWHLKNTVHAEKLFDYALRLTSSDVDESPKLRSMILYSMARFEYDRKELRRAQHYIGLCLRESTLPGVNVKLWELWATIAYEMGNLKLAHQCQEQSSIVRTKGLDQHGTSDNRHIEDRIKSLSDTLRSSTMHDRPDMSQLMRRDPWHGKIFQSTNQNDKNDFMNLSLLPQSDRETTTLSKTIDQRPYQPQR
jgi:tetratricopeptide (TPR) repeat protein